MTYITPWDIIDRLIRRKPHWFHGPPEVSVYGNKGEFGELHFKFVDRGEPIVYRVYLKYGPQTVKDIAEFAVRNANRIAEEHCYYD